MKCSGLFFTPKVQLKIVKQRTRDLMCGITISMSECVCVSVNAQMMSKSKILAKNTGNLKGAKNHFSLKNTVKNYDAYL